MDDTEIKSQGSYYLAALGDYEFNVDDQQESESES